jgi:hypothetical protein
MPPRYKNNSFINFYRLCWNAYERGPPEYQREGPKNKNALIIYKIHLYKIHLSRLLLQKWVIETGWCTASRFF